MRRVWTRNPREIYSAGAEKLTEFPAVRSLKSAMQIPCEGAGGGSDIREQVLFGEFCPLGFDIFPTQKRATLSEFANRSPPKRECADTPKPR
jgi:hypothetical protein